MQSSRNPLPICGLEDQKVAEGELVTVHGVLSLSPHGTGIHLQNPKCPAEVVSLAFDKDSGDSFRKISSIFADGNVDNIIGKYVVAMCQGRVKRGAGISLIIRNADISIQDNLDLD